MQMRSIAVTAALAAATLGITTGTAQARSTDGDTINYAVTNSNTDTVIKTDAGSMVVEDGIFKIKAANGATIAGTELKFRVDDFEFPIAANISDRTATLTPEMDLDHAVYKPVALPYEDQAPWKNAYDREQAAWNRMKDTISLGATVGTLVGGIAGAGVGCILGGVTLATVTGALTAMFGALPAGVFGCIVGMSVVGFLGTLIGNLAVTAPVAILAAVQYFTTINQPMPNTPAK
ncbi:hypothetical protein GPX89_25780 [Nocardia sp. ET3-3]|uniref:DUF8020 domain-containing protein n=1 Tax=Nocardia terrae TaxID=2675851 RepID=A0A7K1V3D2_9NOCA|nr:hypothetical protein [Nocardia terrae]MVU80648.1 hypothetical protein [Nocardia terrae]